MSSQMIDGSHSIDNLLTSVSIENININVDSSQRFHIIGKTMSINQDQINIRDKCSSNEQVLPSSDIFSEFPDQLFVTSDHNGKFTNTYKIILSVLLSKIQ